MTQLISSSTSLTLMAC